LPLDQHEAQRIGLARKLTPRGWRASIGMAAVLESIRAAEPPASIRPPTGRPGRP